MRAAIGLALLGLAACGPDVDGICKDLEECNDDSVERCADHGHELEDKVEEKNCKPEFDAYLTCVDEAKCGWETRCSSTRAALDACVGGLPGP